MISFLLCSVLCETNITIYKLQMAEDRISNFECFNIVRLVNRQIQSGSSLNQTNTLIHDYCDKINGLRKEVCMSISKDKIPQIVALLHEEKTTEFVCDEIGYRKRSFGQRTPISLKDCEIVVDKIKSNFFLNSEKSKINNSQYEPTKEQFVSFLMRRFFVATGPICRDFPTETKLACYVISRIISKNFLPDISRRIPSKLVCKNLAAMHQIKIVN
ncbi:hypothetical protein TRFO_12137 [Tritrichomonas foetus]|uniref:Uncharacterized protein n=1 Tax=Tritrichomonas foetus TaxID=1144522 RepID=A0A1J4J2J2_9EUKA|nr:hypothetical protein TRFO_12137 [Tritrichomonas foetus]|eukprot:OHS92953.1 hypothetical protein TRFO_12137 [Tritrichomonas foetus]